jgi:hypothetical protein
MSKLHTRVIVLTYFEDDLKTHVPCEDPDKFFEALGRAVFYGHVRDCDEDTIQYTSIHFSKNEWVGAYHPTLPAYERREDGSLKTLGSNQSLLDHLHSLRKGRPFVLGAIKHEDGTYSFHS